MTSATILLTGGTCRAGRRPRVSGKATLAVQDGQVGLYKTALNTMALAPVRLALAALPVMRRRGHGRIVTIASVGGPAQEGV